jgi:hypothetical protein
MRRFVSQHRRSSNTGTRSAAPAPLDGASASPTAAKAATTAAIQLPQPTAPAANGSAAAAAAGTTTNSTTVDATLPTLPEAATAAAAAEEEEAAEVVQEAAVLQEQCSAGVDTDALVNMHRPGSIHAALKAKLVDVLDSSAIWERHISNTLGNK